MSLPTQADLFTLDIDFLGLPFVDVEAKTLGTASLDWDYLGLPFVGLAPGSTPPPTYNATQFFMLF